MSGTSKLEVKNADSAMPELWFYGVVGDEYGGFTADDVKNALATLKPKSDMTIRIHSEGGSYMDGIAIHSLLSRWQGKRHVIVDGLAASAGSIIAMAGTSIEMAQGSWMMIHEVQGSIMHAPVRDFLKAIDQMNEINNQLVGIYTRRWKGSENDLRQAVADETWYTPERAMDAGLADSVTESMALAACADLTKFKYTNMPDPVVQAITAGPRSLADREAVYQELCDRNTQSEEK